MADEDGEKEINGKTEELALDNEPYDEDENGNFFLSNHFSIQPISLLCVQSLHRMESTTGTVRIICR